MKIEILHVRDPDFPCDMRVFADGVEVPATDVAVANVDPGAGYDRDDWDATTDDVATDSNLSEGFRSAVLDARGTASDSDHVT